MNKYIKPLKTILLASIQNENQAPFSFIIGRKLKIEKGIKSWLFNEKMIAWFFNRFVYKTEKKVDIKEFLPLLNAPYMRWAIRTILSWKANFKIEELYQIHGTNDRTFPYKKIIRFYSGNDKKLITIKDTGHLLALEKPQEVSSSLKYILVQ